MAIKTFTTGEVLTASDTNTYLANAGLVFVKSQTIGSAVSSVTVSDAFSATYDAYKIVVTGGTPSANSFIKLALGSSTTGYYQARNGLEFGTGARSDGVDNNTSAWTATGAALTNGLGAEINLINPNLAKYTYTSSFYSSASGAVNVSGVHQVATAFTSFVISPVSGTWTGGTVVVYGFRLG